MALVFRILFWMSLVAPMRAPHDEALAIASVVLEEAPLFDDDADKFKTASFLVVVAFRESSLRNDAIGDKGRALCMFQLWHTSRRVLTDPVLCTRIAIRRMRESIKACGVANALGTYAHGPGGCESERAKRISRDRLGLSQRLLSQVQP